MFGKKSKVQNEVPKKPEKVKRKAGAPKAKKSGGLFGKKKKLEPLPNNLTNAEVPVMQPQNDGITNQPQNNFMGENQFPETGSFMDSNTDNIWGQKVDFGDLNFDTKPEIESDVPDFMSDSKEPSFNFEDNFMEGVEPKVGDSAYSENPVDFMSDFDKPPVDYVEEPQVIETEEPSFTDDQVSEYLKNLESPLIDEKVEPTVDELEPAVDVAESTFINPFLGLSDEKETDNQECTDAFENPVYEEDMSTAVEQEDIVETVEDSKEIDPLYNYLINCPFDSERQEFIVESNEDDFLFDSESTIKAIKEQEENAQYLKESMYVFNGSDYEGNSSTFNSNPSDVNADEYVFAG